MASAAILLFGSLSACCPTIVPTSEKTTITVRERQFITQGYTTTANIGAYELLSGNDLIVVHHERITDTVLRVKYLQDGTVSAFVDCPPDTFLLMDTVYVKERENTVVGSWWDNISSGIMAIFMLLFFGALFAIALKYRGTNG